MKKHKLEKHGVTILYLATIGGLGLSFFGSVLNSKLLSKELFGDWKYIQNYLMMISFFVNFGFYYSGGRLIAATDDPKRIATFKGYMMYQCFVGLLVMFFITIVIGLFWQKVLSAELFHLLLVMFPLFIVQPLFFYLEATFQAERKLLSFSIYKILPPFLYVACLYLFQSYSTGNIYFNATLFYITYLAVIIVFISKDKLIFKRKSPELNELIKENKEFGSHLYYGSLWNVGAVYLLPVLIGYFNINNIEVGNYSLALSFVIPFSFLPSIVGTSYFKEFINLDKIPPEAFKKVFVISIVLFALTFIGIGYIVDIFLGAKYKEVAQLVKIGAVGAIIQGFGDFINKFLSAKGKSPFIKKVAIVQGTVLIISSLFLIKWFSSVGAIVAKNTASLIYFVCLYYYYHKNYLLAKPVVTIKSTL
jgi:O-antigen/teichoic acid export membrane protein